MTEKDENYARKLSGIPIAKNFELPSVEQMRREVETGKFSPESIAIAEELLRNAEDTPKSQVVVAGALDEVPGRAEAFKLRMREKREQSQKWREEASKPSAKPSDMLKRTTKRVKHITKNMNQLGEAARQASEAIEAFSPGHLTQRPFHTLEMIAFREILQDQTK